MTTDIPRCATCKWWRRDAPDDPLAEVVEGYGWCPRFRIDLNDHRDLLTLTPLVYPAFKNTRVITHETYGCVLHETKE